MHLILYRAVKDEKETKIDFDIKLCDLKNLGLLKSYKYPFFLFKDNRNSSHKIHKEFLQIDIFETISENEGEMYFLFENYLPRLKPLAVLKRNPEVEEFFKLSKKAVNKLNRFPINPLISEKENLDWFIYDDESLNFLVEIEKSDFSICEQINFCCKNENIIFFQDIHSYIPLTDFRWVYISLSMEDISMKLDSNLTSTAHDILERINYKLQKIKPEMCFEIKTKILKVISLK